MEFHTSMVEKYGLPSWLPEGWVYKPAGKNKKPVFGIGINDVEFACQPTINGKIYRYPPYEVWYSMLQRAHSRDWKEKWPSYSDVTSAVEWNNLSVFLEWFMDSNYQKGYELDKDMSGSKEYSPESCVFLPPKINSLFRRKKADSNTTLPIGVYYSEGRYRASNSTKSFNSIDSAYAEYSLGVHAILLEYIEEFSTDTKLVSAIKKGIKLWK